MNREQLWREFDALPPLAQQQVVDFMEFLRSRARVEAKPDTTSAIDFANDPFVGMWQDRDDLSESSTWVRDMRKREWS